MTLIKLKYSKPRPILSYKLRYIVGFGLVEMAIATNPKPIIYRTCNLYKNTGPASNESIALYHEHVIDILLDTSYDFTPFWFSV